MKKLVTIQKWKTNCPNLFILDQNEIVEKHNDNLQIEKLDFFKKEDKLGWVPEQIINRIEN